MKLTEQQKKMLIVSVFVLFAGGYVYWTVLRDPAPPTASAPPPPVVKTTTTINSISPKSAVSAPPGVGGAQKVGSTAGQLDPTLHMEAMLRTESLVYSGTGRNIFAAGPGEDMAPVKMEQAKFPVRTTATPPQPPRMPTVAGPPPINLKFFGTATSANGNRRAFLLNGDDVWLASVGDVVERRYRIVSISATSIQVEDIPNSNKQTLPLVPN